MADRFRQKLPLILIAAIIGAIVFILIQEKSGYRMTTVDFLGQQITQQGGYRAGLASPIGWAVHLWVAVAWAALYATASGAIFPPRARAIRWGAGLIVAILMAKLATKLSAPVNQILSSLLGKQGFPKNLPPYTPAEFELGKMTPFGNQLIFFLICFAVLIVFHDLTLPRFLPDKTPQDGGRKGEPGRDETGRRVEEPEAESAAE